MSLSIILTTKPLIDPQDPWCDPDHPILLKFEDISAAASGDVGRTDEQEAAELAAVLGESSYPSRAA